MTELWKAMENESQKLMDTNEVGFYISSRMGLAFTTDTLSKLLASSKKFKNSVFVVYDTSKSDYGLNPLHAYRLSEKARGCLQVAEGQIVPTVSQMSITNSGLQINEFFEEVAIKIQRTHMQ